MKRLTWPAALAVVWIGTIGAADAADRSNKFAMKGAGLVTCENYLKARAEKLPSYPNFAGWTMGYITAINQRGLRDLRRRAVAEHRNPDDPARGVLQAQPRATL